MKGKVLLSVMGIAAMMFTSCQQNDVNKFEEASTIEAISNDVTNGDFIPGQYIVVFNHNSGLKINKNTSFDAARKASSDFGKQLLRENKLNGTVLRSFGKSVQGISATLSEADVVTLSKDSRVKYIEQDRKVAIIFRGKPGSGGGGTATQTTPWGITRVNGGVAYSGNNVAYVVDTGIDLDHEDLNVDASRGFNAFTSGKDGQSLDDGNGHGSHVAGTIGAKNNDRGVIGVAAGATVIPVKVLGSRGSGDYSGVIAGVDFVAANGNAGDVANLSLGGPVSVALEDAIAAAAQNGVKFILAAGNEGQDANNVSPARVNGNNIYTISASDVNDRYASFSNYGNPPVDYAEPGVSIYSTYKDGGYATLSGTSMAAPHAAGLLLLGNLSNGGTVSNDPDGNADTIGVR